MDRPSDKFLAGTRFTQKKNGGGRGGNPFDAPENLLHGLLAIETCLKLRLIYQLPLRQTQGLVASILSLLDLDEVPVPHYSTLSRRHDGLLVDLSAKPAKADDEAAEAPEAPEARHIVIDSTGLKVYGEGEWKQRQHGKSKRRTWRKIHLGLDPETGEITATRLTDNSQHDASQVAPLLAETRAQGQAIATVGGDGAYDKWKAYAAIEAAGAQPVIPPQKNAKIKQHGNRKADPLPRDEAIRYIRRHGRRKWKRVQGYHRRSLAETAMFRFKRIIGRVLRARRLAAQVTEARLGSKILNEMLALGRPESYAVALA
jgi:hypothetical protein